MYRGNNTIALKSMEKYKEALLSLMEEKPYSKISVKDICAQANISRQTFYHCFDDKDDVLRYYIRRFLRDGVFHKLKKKEKWDVQSLAKVYITYFENSRPVYRFLIRSGVEHIWIEETCNMMERILYLTPLKEINKEENRIRPYVSAWIAHAITGILTCWIKDENPISSEELFYLLNQLIYQDYFKHWLE